MSTRSLGSHRILPPGATHRAGRSQWPLPSGQPTHADVQPLDASTTFEFTAPEGIEPDCVARHLVHDRYSTLSCVEVLAHCQGATFRTGRECPIKRSEHFAGLCIMSDGPGPPIDGWQGACRESQGERPGTRWSCFSGVQADLQFRRQKSLAGLCATSALGGRARVNRSNFARSPMNAGQF